MINSEAMHEKGPGPDDDLAHLSLKARRLLRASKTGSLATLTRDTGHPYASLVTLATAIDGRPLLLISRLAQHTLNIETDPKVSLMVYDAPSVDDATGDDPLTRLRATVIGTAVKDTSDAVKRRYLARNPEASMYAGFGDFSFYRIEPDTVHVVAGFGAIRTFPAKAVFIEKKHAMSFEEGEAGAVDHMNEDHLDALALYATCLLGEAEGDWRITACDPDGADLTNGEKTVRLPFPETASAFSQLRHIFKRMSDAARQP